MKILFILEYYYPHIGGVETLFRNLTESLSELGHEITVLTNKHDKSLPKEEKRGNISIKRLSLNNRYLFTFFSVFTAVKLARDHELIHTTSYNAAVPAYVASKLTGTKAIITFHEVWGKLWFNLPWLSQPTRILNYCFEQMILKMNFLKFIAVSHFTQNALLEQGVNPNSVGKIYNGIDYSEYINKIPEDKKKNKTFIYFGRVGVSKGIDIILQAVEALLKERSDFKVKLILPQKSDRLTKKVIRNINNQQLSEHVLIQHSIPFDLLKETVSDALAVIIPSYSEGFCFAAVETMAIGTPIISSGRGALKEVVGGPYLEFQEMKGSSLKEKMKEALNGKWDHLPLQKFELRDSVEKYLKLYEDLQTY